MARPLRRGSEHRTIEIARPLNVLVHDYRAVDLVRVWNAVFQDLPAFKRTVLEILEGLKR